MSPPSEKVVLVLGPSGCGKSQLISCGANRGNQGVVHTLAPGTEHVEVVRTTLAGEPIVFIDTPGFEESYMSPINVLTEVSEILEEQNLKVDIVLYLHRINDNRMAGSILKNLGLFQSICGGIAMQNVIVVVTMCGQVARSVKDMRFAELKSNFWADIEKQGATFACFGDSHNSVREIIIGAHEEEPIQSPIPRFTFPTLEPRTTTRRPHRGTEAGIALNLQLEALIRDKKKQRRRMDDPHRYRHRARRTSVHVARRMPAAKESALQAEMRKIDQGIEDTVEKLKLLNAPFSRAVNRTVKKWLRKKSSPAPSEVSSHT